MKGLRKQITRAVNPNPRSCPPPTIKNKPRTVVDPRTPPRVVESIPEEVLPNLDSEKK